MDCASCKKTNKKTNALSKNKQNKFIIFLLALLSEVGSFVDAHPQKCCIGEPPNLEPALKHNYSSSSHYGLV